MVRILVTDDSAFQRNIIISILKDQQYEYLEACNGKEAIDIAVKERPDLILLDLYMPVSDGFAFLEEAKKRELGIPVIMLTSDIQDTSKNRCLELGATDFLTKPVVREELVETIAEIIKAE